jgi:hypothetical protein
MPPKPPAKKAAAKNVSSAGTKPAPPKKTAGQPQASPAANAAAGACVSKASATPGCLVDCQTKSLTLSLKPLQGIVTIVNAEYPPGTAVQFTTNSITFTPQKGVKNLMVSYAFAPSTSRAKLVENCQDQTLWDNNVNISQNPAPYAVCA